MGTVGSYTHPMLSPEFGTDLLARAEGIGVQLDAGSVELVERLESLWLSLFDHHRAVMQVPLEVVPRGETWPRRRALYRTHLTEDDGFIYLASRDGEPVGYTLVYFRPGYDDTWVSGPRIAEIESLAVAPSERGRGLGSLLLDAVDARLARMGVRDVRLSVMVGNDSAMAFYARRGLVPTLTVLGRRTVEQ